MPDTPIVIVSGPPCTGKTTLGQRLAHDLRLPFLSKDLIKEALFDTLGWSDREWSRVLGAATIELLYLWMETELAADRSFLVECNFDPDLATTRFVKLREKRTFTACQVLCHTEGAVLIERFRRRTESGERHPGHVDHTTYDELAPTLLKGGFEPLRIGGSALHVDTTDFTRIDYAAVVREICAALPGV